MNRHRLPLGCTWCCSSPNGVSTVFRWIFVWSNLKHTRPIGRSLCWFGTCLIPSCILKSNSHIGEVGQGTDAVGISSELGEAGAERVLQSIKGRERLVGQDLLPQFFPDMLGWIEFRTAGRLGQ